MFHLHLSSRGYCLRAFLTSTGALKKKKQKKAAAKHNNKHHGDEEPTTQRMNYFCIFSFPYFYLSISDNFLFHWIHSLARSLAGIWNNKRAEHAHMNQKKMRYYSWSCRVLMDIWCKRELFGIVLRPLMKVANKIGATFFVISWNRQTAFGMLTQCHAPLDWDERSVCYAEKAENQYRNWINVVVIVIAVVVVHFQVSKV